MNCLQIRTGQANGTELSRCDRAERGSSQLERVVSLPIAYKSPCSSF